MADEAHISQLVLQAESCLDRGDLAQARRLYADICRVRDNDAQAWLMFGAINGEMGNIEVAQNALEKAVALEPGNAEAHLALAHVLKEKGQLEEALAAGRRAVLTDTGFLEGWLFIAAAAGQLANWAVAEDACNKAVALAPASAAAHFNLGNVLLTTGRAAQAEESFRTALTLQEAAAPERKADTAVFREALAKCLEYLGRHQESAALRAGLQ